MKFLVIIFEDDQVDLSVFPPGTQVAIANSASQVEGGKVYFQTTPLAQMPVFDHTHPVSGITGEPQ